MMTRRSMGLKFLGLLILISFLLSNNNISTGIVAKTNSLSDTNVVVDGVVTDGEYQNSLYLDSLNQYKMSYTLDNTTDTIYFGLEVNTRGWIGLGFDPTNVSRTPPHAGADIIQGGYNGGTYIFDEYADSSADFHSDGSSHQDFIQSQASQNTSWTTLEFSRKINTGDIHDKIITPNAGMQLIWSFKSTDAYQDHHDHQGSAFAIFYDYKYVPPVLPPNQGGNSNTSTFNVKIDGVINQGEYPNALYMDSLGQYLLNYGIVNGTIYIGLQVKTQGWVGIGFKTTSPAVDKHLGADIMLGAYFDNNGSTGFKDDYGNSQTTHVPDTTLGGTKDITNAVASQDATTTYFEFSKALNTGDQYDVVITPESPIYVMWSYHLTIDDMLTQHSAMGFNLLTLHEFTGNSTSAPQASTPFAPNLDSASYKSNGVNLAWTAPTYDGGASVTNYNVYRRLTTETLYVYVDQSSGLSFIDTTVDANVAYYYVITAVNSVGESINSNSKWVSTNALPVQTQTNPASTPNGNSNSNADNSTAETGVFPSLPVSLSWALAIPGMYAGMFMTLAGVIKYKGFKSRHH